MRSVYVRLDVHHASVDRFDMAAMDGRFRIPTSSLAGILDPGSFVLGLGRFGRAMPECSFHTLCFVGASLKSSPRRTWKYKANRGRIFFGVDSVHVLAQSTPATTVGLAVRAVRGVADIGPPFRRTHLVSALVDRIDLFFLSDW